MSVIISKYMEVVGGNRTMKEILGNIVRPMKITRHTKSGTKFTLQTRTLEAVDLFEIAPQMFDKEADEKRGFVFTDCGGDESEKEKYISQGFEIVLDAYPEGEEKNSGSHAIMYSRPYEKEMLESLYREPVRYCNDGVTLWWSGNYRVNEDVDSAISMKFPDIIFDVCEHVDGDEVTHYHLKNGKIIKDYYP